MTRYIYLVVVLSFFSFIKVNALDNININNETLSPLFNKDIYIYNYYTNKDNIKIFINKSSNEIVSGYGYYEVKNGLNEFFVISNNISYKINVYKNYTKDSNSIASFKSLKIDNYDIEFSNDIFEYYINDFNDSKLNISYEVDSSSSIVKISGNGDFKSGNNDVILLIESYDKKVINKYIIHVNITKEVFKEIKKEKQLSYTQKEIIIIIIVIISCSLIIYVYYLLFIKKIF